MKYSSDPMRIRMRRRLLSATGVVLGFLVGCATYDGIRTPQTSDPIGEGGADASAGGAPSNSAGRDQDDIDGGPGGSSTGGDSQPDTGGGGSGDSSGNAGDAGDGGSSGALSASGSAGKAGGAGGTLGGAGITSAGGAGMPGDAGGSIAAGAGGSLAAGAGGASDELLSQGKPAIADSTQGSNVATFANDGSIVTRWCAANADPNHYWQVDLGSLRTLSRVDVAWEKAANYKFKVEGSSESTTWSMLLDRQSTTNATSGQSYKLDTAPKARWVKVTVTSLPNSTTWASFYELQVFGH